MYRIDNYLRAQNFNTEEIDYVKTKHQRNTMNM